MLAISNDRELYPFLGEVIAFTSDSDYFNHEDRCYTLSSAPGLRFALIGRNLTDWPSGRGPSAYRLLKADACTSACAMNTSRISGSNLEIRLASAIEVALFYEAASRNEAKVEGLSNSAQILEARLDLLLTSAV